MANLRVKATDIPTSGARGGDSDAMAKEDKGRMDGYKTFITRVGRAKGIDPAIIAGIISRETRAGSWGLVNGYNSQGIAYGLMQVSTKSPRGAWNSEDNIAHGTEILIEKIQAIADKSPSWSNELKFKGGIAAYNCGEDHVCSEDVDRGTEGGDYANDVVARAQWFSRNGY